MPKTAMHKRAQLIGLRQLLHRFALPDRIVAADQFTNRRRENKKAAVDPAAVIVRLLPKRPHAIAIDDDCAKSPCRTYRRDGRLPAMRLVEVHFSRDVDIGNTVTIGQRKVWFVFHIIHHAFDASAGLRHIAGVDQRHPPGFGGLPMHLHAIFSNVKRNVRHVHKVISEKLFDDVALIAKTHDEIVKAIPAVDLHDVPQDWAPADFHHRLRTHLSLFGKPGSHSTCQDYNFHEFCGPGWIALWNTESFQDGGCWVQAIITGIRCDAKEIRFNLLAS